MPALHDALTGSFVTANLGSGGDTDYDLPPPFLKTMTLIEIDGGRNASSTHNQYCAKHTIYEVVAGDALPGQFTIRNFRACSSLVEPKPEIITEYGLQKFYEVRSSQQVIPASLPTIMARLNIRTLDFLKTDLEGVDFEVIKSCDHLLPRVLAIKSELRFQPFYMGEPYFHEVVQYLHERGFELIGLKPEYWKPVTENRNKHRDGRVVFADAFFFKKPERIRDFPEGIKALSAAKQILIAGMSGKKSYAEWLLEQYREVIPDEWIGDLKPVVHPGPEKGITMLLKKILSFPKKKFKNLKTIRHRKNGDSLFDFSHIAPAD